MCGRQLYCACVFRRNNCNLPIPIIIDVYKFTIFEIGEIFFDHHVLGVCAITTDRVDRLCDKRGRHLGTY